MKIYYILGNDEIILFDLSYDQWLEIQSWCRENLSSVHDSDYNDYGDKMDAWWVLKNPMDISQFILRWSNGDIVTIP